MHIYIYIDIHITIRRIASVEIAYILSRLQSKLPYDHIKEFCLLLEKSVMKR